MQPLCTQFECTQILSDQQGTAELCYSRFCCTVPSSFLPSSVSEESVCDLSRGDILLHPSICVTDIHRPHRQAEVRSWLWLILFALQTFVAKNPALSSRLISLLPVLLVTTTERLSSRIRIGVREEEKKKILLLRLSRWMRTSRQTGAREREICCAASAPLWFLSILVKGFHVPCFCSRRSEYHKTMGAVILASGSGDGK